MTTIENFEIRSFPKRLRKGKKNALSKVDGMSLSISYVVYSAIDNSCVALLLSSVPFTFVAPTFASQNSSDDEWFDSSVGAPRLDWPSLLHAASTLFPLNIWSRQGSPSQGRERVTA